jgi:hypothetical protein
MTNAELQAACERMVAAHDGAQAMFPALFPDGTPGPGGFISEAVAIARGCLRLLAELAVEKERRRE